MEANELSDLEAVAKEFGIPMEVLSENGINTPSGLFELPDVDVRDVLNLRPSDAIWPNFVKKRAEFQNRKANPYNWSTEDVAKWLETNGCMDVKEIFVSKAINGRGLLALTYDDLGTHLGIKILKAKRELWNCIENLMKNSPAKPVNNSTNVEGLEEEEPNEVIRVPEIAEEPHLALSQKNWPVYKREASRTSYLPRISFVGPTQCGKSHFLTELMDFNERFQTELLTSYSGPSTAAPSQEHPTTGNVNQYHGIVNSQKVMLLDGEGADGRLPLKFVHRIKQKLKSLLIPQQKFDEYNLKRTEYVSKKLPQLFYAISNIIIFTNRQALANRDYITRIQQFALHSVENQQSRNLPYLIIIQNFANPQAELAENPDEDPYNPKISTEKFISSIENEHKECKELLDIAFSGFCFLKVPDGRVAPTKYSDQIRLLKEIIEREIQNMRTNNACYTLNPKNSFTDFMWYRVTERVIEALNNDLPINISDIFFRVNVPSDSTKKNAALKLFHEVFKSMPEPSGNTVKEYMMSRIKRFKDARKLALEMYCLAISEDLKEHNLNDVSKDNVQKVLFSGYFDNLLSYFEDLQPCERYDKDGCCMQDRNVHACHTYENPTKKTSILRFLFKKIKTFTYSAAEIEVTDDFQDVKQFILAYLEIVLKASPKELFDLRTQATISFPTGKLEYKYWEKNCGFCLAPYKPSKEKQENFEQHVLMLYDCGHYFCDKCVKGHVKLHCPYHKKEVEFIDDKAKVPAGAAPRVLSLDGGGVRGLVLIQMLKRLEELTGAQTSELFDYIIGTSVGGIVSLAIGSGKSVQEIADHYTAMIKNVFTTNFFRQIFALGGSARYSKTTLINELKNQFGDTNLANLAMTKAPKVAAVSSLETKQKTALFVSYTPTRDKKNSYAYIFGFPLHFAAAASSAAPLYFNPINNGQDIFVDGGIKANNPADIGLQEATRLWSQPDVLVSLGTGLTEAQVSSSISILYWINRLISLVTDSKAIDQRLEQHLSQPSSITDYFRFSPELRKTIPLDTIDKKMLGAMEQDTANYMEKFKHRFTTAAQVLLAKLFYASVNVEENRYKIRIHSRLDLNRTKEVLNRQQVFKNPHFHLDVILNSKAASSYHSIYINRIDTIEQTPDGNLVHAQGIPFNYETPFGTFDFSIEKVRRSVVAVVCITDSSSPMSLRFPISGCPIRLEMHENLASSVSGSL